MAVVKGKELTVFNNSALKGNTAENPLHSNQERRTDTMKNNSLQLTDHLHKKNGINRKKIFSAYIVGFIVFLFFSLVGSIFAFLPPPATISRFITVISLSLLIGIAGVWNKLRPSWMAQLIIAIALTGLLLAWAIHCLSFGVTGVNKLMWLVPLVAAYIIAWILPVIDPSLAKVVDNEQFAPKTKLGRGCLTVALSIGGAAGAMGAMIGRTLYKSSGIQPVMLIMGIGISIITVGLAQTFAYQIYAMRLREMRVKQNSEQTGSQ
jgi:hypothetical protein